MQSINSKVITMIKIEVIEGLDYPVTLEQYTKLKFKVTYGKQVRKGLQFAAAMDTFTGCVKHSAKCSGSIK